MNDEKMVDIDLDEYGVAKEPKNDKIACTDADTIAFTACLAAEEEVMVLDESFYHIDEWQEILDNPTYDDEKGIYYEIDLDRAMEHAIDKIDRILERTGCKGIELHFTTGKCFRYKLYSDYKANRIGGHAPTGLRDLKQMLADKYNGIIHETIEADDYVVYACNKHPDKYICCGVDKDVLYSVEGHVFNYYESGHHNIDMKWVDVDAKTVKYYPFVQCIAGDTSDNIFGPKGIGPKTMAKFFNGKPLPAKIKVKKPHEVIPYLKDDLTDKELWNAVVKAYEAKGLTEADAYLNMNLVNMNLLQDDGKIKLWEIPHE